MSDAPKFFEPSEPGPVRNPPSSISPMGEELLRQALHHDETIKAFHRQLAERRMVELENLRRSLRRQQAERLARMLHEAHEKFRPQFEPGKAGLTWDEAQAKMTDQEKQWMLLTCEEVVKLQEEAAVQREFYGLRSLLRMQE